MNKRRLISYLLLSPLLTYLFIVGIEEFARYVIIKIQVKFSYTTKNSPLLGDVQALLPDENGGMWIGTENGLNHLKPDNSWESFIEQNSGLLNHNITALALDSQNKLWVGTENGLYILSPNGTWITFIQPMDNRNYQAKIYDIAIQDEQTIIGSSREFFKYVYNAETNTYVRESPFMYEAIRAVALHDIKRWIGTDSGLVFHEDYKPEIIFTSNYQQPENGLSSSEITELFLDNQKRLWVGTDWGVNVINPDNTITRIEVDTFTRRVNAIAQDNQGRVWVSQSSTLFVVNTDGSIVAYPSNHSDIGSARVIAIDEKGRLWIGSYSEGLKIVDLNAGLPLHISKDWGNLRNLFIIPLLVIVEFLQFIFLPIFFPIPPLNICFISLIFSLIAGILGIKKGRKNNDREKINVSWKVLIISIIGLVSLWALTFGFLYLIFRD